ncbi:MAG TPA: spermidine/putrescine ABC transporter substrate-binding protein [Hyphomicrobiales bacterium]|nr:spermidine/putrescine ABC transporter substrate-binding protein [Hyphomicrobiales bacterium]
MKINDRDRLKQLDKSIEELNHARITRREFARRAMALGISTALLTDILGLHKKALAAEGPSPEVLKKIKKEGGELFVYNWEEYIHPDTIPTFEKEFGVKVTYDTFPGNEHLLAKLQAGSAQYDVVVPTSNFVPIHIAQGLLEPLDHANIPDLKNCMPRFLDTSVDPGNKYTVPYLWGMTALAHNTKYTKDDPNVGSWALMFESGPERYSGKLAFTDEREEVMATALAYLGYSVNSRKKDELMEAGELLIKTKPHVKAFYPGAEETKALVTEDVIVGHEWNGEVVKAHRENPAVEWILPKEGGTAWFDNMAIAKGAPHKFTAETFINFMLRPDIAAANSEAGGYATANRVAVEKFVPAEVAQDPSVYPTEDELSRLEFLAVIPDDILPIYDDIWTRLLGA